MSLTLFRTYLCLNKGLQRILYNHIDYYRLDLFTFFSKIKELSYITLKTDTPYMVNGFPLDYPIGRDIDLIVTKKDFNSLVENVICFAHSHHGFKIKEISEEQGFQLRFEFGEVLHYLIHVSYGIAGLSSMLIEQSIESRQKVENYYIPELRYEIVYRLVDYHKQPHKIYHLQYVKKHVDSMDWSLFKHTDIKNYINDLLLKA